ncbi:MAG: hypothetical protein LBV09_00740, partial [Deferribacteraceae bacterium]|nr:hypothetical protein [Deferribacteraceae bacterium]
MKKITTIIIIALLSSSIAFGQAKSEPKYDVNFKNITMKEFVTFVADFTGINIVYNETDLRGNVSVVSQYPMNAADVIAIFNATLNSNGLSAINEGNYIRVVADKDMVMYND